MPWAHYDPLSGKHFGAWKTPVGNERALANTESVAEARLRLPLLQ